MSRDVSEVLNTVSKNIRFYRKRLGISQMELSLRCDTHRTTVGRIERRERKPGTEILAKIAIGLDIDIIDLFKR